MNSAAPVIFKPTKEETKVSKFIEEEGYSETIRQQLLESPIEENQIKSSQENIE